MENSKVFGLLGFVILLCLSPAGCKPAPPEKAPETKPEGATMESEYTVLIIPSSKTYSIKMLMESESAILLLVTESLEMK